LNNYPIKLFDNIKYDPELLRGANMKTLGLRFKSRRESNTIDNLLDFIWSLVLTAGHVQQEIFYNDPMDRIRSINIDSLELSPIDFNIRTGDETYRQLYNQGYLAAEAYFSQ
jgi:NTE family protein